MKSIINTQNEDLVREVTADFDTRREMRRGIETKWLLNINFLIGNQYSTISAEGDINDFGKRFFWQEREVYNHIAPIIETRLAKFSRIKSAVSVRPSSSEDSDVNVAKLATKLIDAAQQENNFTQLISSANYWTELTGTAFFKVVWAPSKGCLVAKVDDNEIYQGDIKISVCPPYEIYPDSLASTDVDNCSSIIHAKAYTTQQIKDIWGVELKGSDVSVINMSTTDNSGGMGYSSKNYKVHSDIKTNHAIVIEKYFAPSKAKPNGRLVIVAEDKLLFDGELPYKNGSGENRGFPFIRQVALEQPTSFYGNSIIERIIPIQRAYNAVKNRKHEFLNRLASGIMMVEDGSIDVENLEEDGLSPGKVLIYRQGSIPPKLMSAGVVPGEFRDEEDRLLNEFIAVSGVSDFMTKSNVSSSTVSGFALSLLIEQDDTRLSVTADSMRNAVREVGKHILRLYRQFAKSKRFKRISGDNGVMEVVAFSGSELTSDDIVLATETEMSETPATRKNMVIELLKLGLLGDQNGVISNRNKTKILEMMGFGNWESARSFDEIHIKKAELENNDFLNSKNVKIEEVDDHEIHIEEHSRFIIQGRDSLSDKAKTLINNHIREHRVINRLAKQAEQNLISNEVKQ